jgi:AraC-like DNA-binding protein
MTGVETIARIRLENFQNGKRIKRIARELGLARDTVRKVLRSGATEFVYKREVQPRRTLNLLIFHADLLSRGVNSSWRQGGSLSCRLTRSISTRLASAATELGFSACSPVIAIGSNEGPPAPGSANNPSR